MGAMGVMGSLVEGVRKDFEAAISETETRLLEEMRKEVRALVDGAKAEKEKKDQVRVLPSTFFFRVLICPSFSSRCFFRSSKSRV
jgi:hypothetical protein